MNTCRLGFAVLCALAFASIAESSTPSSPNRLVFNDLIRAETDLNADGRIDVLDALAGVPAATDAVVFFGAAQRSELFYRNAQGTRVVNDVLPVDGLQDAIALSRELKVPLFIQGHFAITQPLKVGSNTFVSGYSSSPAVVHSLIPNGSTLFNIKLNAANVAIKDMILVEVEQLRVAMILLSGKNKDVSLSGLRFVGSDVGDITKQTAGIYMFKNWVDTVHIQDCDFSDLQYGIHSVCGVTDLKILRNRFRRWNYYAIRIARIGVNDVLQTSNIDISRNDFRDPVIGPFRSVVLVSRADSLVYVTDVRVNHNTIIGDGGAYVLGDDQSDSTGDQIVLHGVNGFQVSENRVFFGGENGITASRLSRNGVISRNVLYGNDTHGFNIGSGHYELSVSSSARLQIGDTIQGTDSQAQADIESIQINSSDGRIVVGLKRILGGKTFRDEPLNNLTTGEDSVAYASHVDRTKKIRVVDNLVYGNGQDRANNTPWTFGVYAQNADSVEFRRNRIFNPDYDEVNATGEIQKQRKCIYLANCRNIVVSDDNEFEQGKESIDEALGMNGSSWLRGGLD